MLKKSLELSKKIFKPYRKLIKAGVILHRLQSNQYKQTMLFNERDLKYECNIDKLNNLIDNINQKTRRDLLGWGSSIIERDWNPRRESLSRLKTTAIENIPTVFAN